MCVQHGLLQAVAKQLSPTLLSVRTCSLLLYLGVSLKAIRKQYSLSAC